jgi:hypothetical protein
VIDGPRLVNDQEPDAGSPFRGGRLLKAADVGAFLQLDPKKVYELPIPRILLSGRRGRYLESDVLAFISKHRRSV